MNAAGNNDMDMNGVNGEDSGRPSRPRYRPNRSSNTESGRESLTNNQPHNDCGKLCDGTGGARPKVKHLYCNIPNGVSPVGAGDESFVKVNNNLPVSTTDCDDFECGRPSSSSTADERLNGLNFNCNNGLEPNGVESYLRNNVNCRASVDKCPFKGRDCSNVTLGFSKTAPSRSNVKNNGYAKVDYSDRFSSSRARPSIKRDDNDSSSSNTGNEAEDGSSEDECCIYTYKGDQVADLPSSFFRMDLAVGDQAGAVGGREDEGQANGDHSRSMSPEMDFLEMDFDPGPSCEQDSEEDSDRGSLKDEVEDLPYAENPPSGIENPVENSASNDLNTAAVRPASPVINDLGNDRVQANPEVLTDHHQEARSLLHPNWSLPHSCSSKPDQGCSSQRTTRDVLGHHCSSGDLCSPGDIDGDSWLDCAGLFNTTNGRLQGDDPRKSNLHSALYHCIMAKRLVLNKHASFSEDDDSHENPDSLKSSIERTMIWSEREACSKQVTQISTSACGATAVINVLLALNIPFNVERVKEGVATRLRQDSSPLPEYLFSRSVAGAAHVDLIRGLEVGSGGSLYARFFPTYPPWSESVSRWLAYWMKKGAVPIATLNLQHGVAPGNIIPDAWHHQMVFGVGPEGVYLTNPLEFVSESTLYPQLSSPSVLLIRRADVIGRWNQTTDLRPLMKHPDIRWKKMNVLGQVVNVIREWACHAPQSQGRVVTPHVAIPCIYQPGFTMAIPKESPAYQELKSAPVPAVALQY